MGAVSPPAGPRQSYKFQNNHKILEKKIFFNHKVGEMHAIWRIQCFIKWHIVKHIRIKKILLHKIQFKNSIQDWVFSTVIW